jgi:hypothetical protein
LFCWLRSMDWPALVINLCLIDICIYVANILYLFVVLSLN